jgi:hypothetical protein
MTAASVAVFGGALLAPQAMAASSSVGFTGSAYGTSAHVGNLIVSGPTAAVGLGCMTPPNIHLANTLATADVPGVATVGAIDSTASTTQTAQTAGDSTSATIADLNVLSGLIKVGAIKAVSTTGEGPSGIHVTALGSSLAGLSVNGEKFAVTPPANTTIALPGIGKVVLNEQYKTTGTDSVTFTVNMIHVYITATDLVGIKAGTEVIVGHASSGLDLPGGVVTIEGDAYSTSVQVAGLVTSGPTFGIGLGLGCGDDSGALETDAAVGVNLPPIAVSGTLANTSQGVFTAKGATGETTSSIQKLNLLGGLIKAEVIKADAHATVSGATSTFSDAGSELVGLVVGGHAIPVDVGPNTSISLLGLTVWLHRVVTTPTSISVRMLEITGVPPASLHLGRAAIDIRVAVAELAT